MTNNVLLFGGNFTSNVIKPSLKAKNDINIIAHVESYNHFKVCMNKIITGKNINIAIIALPPFKNHQIVKLLSKNPSIKKIYLEKPLSNNVSNANKIYSIARYNNINIFTNYSFIFFEPFIQLKKFIADKKIISYSFVWNSNTKQIFHRGSKTWKNKKSLGGGGLSNFGSHIISLLINYFGKVDVIESSLFNKNEDEKLDEYKGTIETLHGIIKGFFSYNIRFGGEPLLSFNIRTERYLFCLECKNSDYFTDYKLFIDGKLVYSYKNNSNNLDSRMPIISNSLDFFLSENTFITNFDNALITQKVLQKIRKSNSND
jgi:predicted dehydrogenase